MDNNTFKREVVAGMEYLLKCFTEKLAVLDALDRDTDSSGAYDLHDQIHTLSKCSSDLADCLNRTGKVIPHER